MRRLIIFLLLVVLAGSVRAISPIEELQTEIDKLSASLEMSRRATTPLEAELSKLRAQLANIQAGIDKAKAELRSLEISISEREKEFGQNYVLLAERALSFYKASRQNSSLLILFSNGPAGIMRDLFYRRVATDRDKNAIAEISIKLIQLEADKKKAQEDKAKLDGLQVKVDKEAKFFEGEISGAKAYQAKLSQQIASLSARQQSILAEKSGTFQTTVGDVPLADDPASRPDYKPGFSPAFAAFSFGAPHFKGMSQYGAYGRAKSGQGEEQILKAYYGDVRIEKVDTGGDINTLAGTMNFEDKYLMGIAEMPSSWTDNNLAALKAQAIAARSYALAYIGWRMGNRAKSGTICTSENCQVWSENKANNTPEDWKRAVKDTEGKILVGNGSGEVVNAWYASTSGGYQESYSSLGHSTPGFWDTPSGRGGWTSQAYEKTAGSPWFYKGWYKNRSGDSCGRSHPWLTSEEMADILNAWTVLFQGKGDSSRVTPADTSCWGGNPYSREELRSIGEFSSVSDVSVSYSDSGVTANVTFATNKGSVSINGNDFYKAFNLRAPGRIALKSGLYNIERR